MKHADIPAWSDRAESMSGKYAHYRGGIYEVITVARLEGDYTEMVVYRAVDSGLMWVRPVEEFLAVIETESGLVPRFRKL